MRALDEVLASMSSASQADIARRADELQAAHHMASASELVRLLGLPARDATGLARFDGKRRSILLWVKKSALKRCAIQIPTTFNGFEVAVEPLPKFRALAA